MSTDWKQRIAADTAAAEALEAAAVEALKANKRTARILYKFNNQPTGQKWAAIEILGPPHGLSYTAAPARNAEQAVQLVNEMHRYVDALFEALLNDDRKAAQRILVRLFQVGQRSVGRPAVPEEDAEVIRALATKCRKADGNANISEIARRSGYVRATVRKVLGL